MELTVAFVTLLLQFSIAASSDSVSTTDASTATLTVIPPTKFPAPLRSIGRPTPDGSNANATVSRRSGYHDGYDIILSCGISYHGADLIGEDHNQIAISGLGHANCYILCDWYILNCEAATWTSDDGGTCWFKWTVFPILATLEAGATTAYFTVKDPTIHDDQFAVYPYGNCDMEGYDIGNVRQLTPYGCVTACNKVPNCWAWTWTDYNGGTCWLKNQARECVVKKGAQSGYHYKRVEKAGTCMGLPPTGIYSS